jgi:hypothetical protein
MKQARLADGTTLQFPDETPDDVMDQAVQRHIAENRTPEQRQGDAEQRRVEAGRAASPGIMGTIGDVARQIGQGVTFGGYDELTAGLEGGVNAITGGRVGRPYGEALEVGRSRDAAFRQDNPVISTLLNVGGGMAVPLPGAGPAQAGAGLLARALRSAPVRGATAGAAGGAAAGFGEGEGGLAQRAGSAATGAGLGALFGGAVGSGITFAGTVGGRLLQAAGLRNPEVAADRQLIRALGRDNITPTDLAGRVNVAESPQAIADLGGRNTVNLAATAANTPSEAMQVADQFVTARRAGRPERVADLVDNTLGGGGGTRVLDDMDELRRVRTETSAPLYAQAFAQAAPDTPAVRQIMELPEVKSAVAQSMRFQEMQSVAAGQAFQPNPMMVLDAAKRALDEKIAATLDPVTGRIIPGRGQENIAFTDLRNALVRELDAVPEYAAARAAWAGPTQTMEAMALGQRALGMNPDQLQLAVRQIGTGGDMDAARVGLGRAITDVTSDPARAVGAIRRMSEDGNMQRRFEALVPDQAMREQIIEVLKREARMGQVEQAVSPRAGSQTARLLAGGDDMGNDPLGGAAFSALGGNINGALRYLFRQGQGINSATSDALAPRLMNTDPAMNQATALRLIDRELRDRLNATERAALSRALLQGLGVGAGVAAN